ncbi:radical SAM protein [Methanocalculus chunghsingensis]|uniref:Radical SAM protein n=1 Tax=Methanocalculus chunghsingensis TaxID=156457 RepID=A0A8J8B4E6_9EURY|nr:radical SAM protein [Methanocalculus chunghsingensis]
MVFFHIYLTDDCNLCCRYCRGKMFDDLDEIDFPCEIASNLPPEFDESLLDPLYRFLARDPDPVVTFIGGEPLLRQDLICRIIDEAPCSRFMLQTNGLLLNSLSPDYRNQFETILISIDGPEDLTDYNRGEGVYNRIAANIQVLKDNGFSGELIARMTVDEETDIHASVTHLAFGTSSPFQSIHWQMDANFWGDYKKRRFREWVAESYNPGINALFEDWIRHMREHGDVLRWYPFLSTTEDLLLNRTSGLRCGSGVTNYTIQTDGSIIPCPIMTGMKDLILGSIKTADPCNLPISLPGLPCTECSIHEFCGGRCLYSNIIRPWPEEGREEVCSTIHHLRSTLLDHIPEIQNLIQKGTINLSSFQHTRFNGCEIIP